MFEDNLPPGVRGSDIDARVESEENCLIQELRGKLEKAESERDIAIGHLECIQDILLEASQYYSARDVAEILRESLDAIDALRARLAWIYVQCNQMDVTRQEIGRVLCRVVAGGIVGDKVYEDEDAAIDAAIDAERIVENG